MALMKIVDEDGCDKQDCMVMEHKSGRLYHF